MSREGRVLIGAADRAVVVRLEGRLTQSSVSCIAEAATQCAAADAEDLLIDIRLCNYMDSTILGSLARWALRFQQQRGHGPFLVGLQGGDLEQTFKRMSLDKLFKTAPATVTSDTDATLGKPLAVQEHGNNDHARRILVAHETLAELSPENAKEFSLLLDLLRKETGPSTGGASPAFSGS